MATKKKSELTEEKEKKTVKKKKTAAVNEEKPAVKKTKKTKTEAKEKPEVKSAEKKEPSVKEKAPKENAPSKEEALEKSKPAEKAKNSHKAKSKKENPVIEEAKESAEAVETNPKKDYPPLEKKLPPLDNKGKDVVVESPNQESAKTDDLASRLEQVKAKLLKEAGEHDGFLSEDEVNKIVAPFELNDDDQDEIFNFCQDKGILETSEDEILLEPDVDLVDDNDIAEEEIEDDILFPAADVKNADPVRQYLHSIGTYQVLKNKDEEVNLAKRILAGEQARQDLEPVYQEYLGNGGMDDFDAWCENMDYPSDDNFEIWDKKEEYLDGHDAKDALIQCNLKLVVSIAKHYVNRGMDFLDLIQEGNLGLMKAVGKFDYTRGFKFSTYATWWIRQAITRALADQARTIRIPVHMVETINKITRAQRKLVQKLNRDPTPEEISEELGGTWSPSRIAEIQQIALDPLSLEKPVGEEEDSHVGDFIVDKDNESPYDFANRSMETERINEVLDQLTDREARVIRLRYGLEDGRTHTLEEVGKEFNVTRERIRQIEAKALKKLRHPSRAKLLKDFRNEF